MRVREYKTGWTTIGGKARQYEGVEVSVQGKTCLFARFVGGAAWYNLSESGALVPQPLAGQLTALVTAQGYGEKAGPLVSFTAFGRTFSF